jgi:hypothetical protein
LIAILEKHFKVTAKERVAAKMDMPKISIAVVVTGTS